MRHFDDLTEPPVPGKFYLVRTVRGSWYDEVADWPVMGPKHTDVEFIRFEAPHYHINRWFLDESVARRTSIHPLTAKWNGHGYDENDPLPPPVLRKLKCRRAESIPFPSISRASPAGRKRFGLLYSHFSGAQCKRGNGWICPHKGFDLGPMTAGNDGNIQCPLHGMLINVVTGIVAAHTRLGLTGDGKVGNGR